jgi:hypothetical protein
MQVKATHGGVAQLASALTDLEGLAARLTSALDSRQQQQQQQHQQQKQQQRPGVAALPLAAAASLLQPSSLASPRPPSYEQSLDVASVGPAAVTAMTMEAASAAAASEAAAAAAAVGGEPLQAPGSSPRGVSGPHAFMRTASVRGARRVSEEALLRQKVCGAVPITVHSRHVTMAAAGGAVQL